MIIAKIIKLRGKLVYKNGAKKQDRVKKKAGQIDHDADNEFNFVVHAYTKVGLDGSEVLMPVYVLYATHDN